MTTTTTDPVLDHLRTAFAQTDDVLAALRPSDDALPTPCPEWDVTTIADHIVGALEMFGAAAGADTSDPTGTTRLERYRSVSAAVADAWSAPGVLDATVDLPFGTFPVRLAVTINLLETFVHACDLAVATGNEALVDDRFCDEVRAMADAAGFDLFRHPGMFGPAVEPATDSGLGRLMGFVGRSGAS